MSRFHKTFKPWHPDYEILPPRGERELTKFSRNPYKKTPPTISTAYRFLSRPEDFTRPYSRSRSFIKSFAAAAATLRASRRKSQEDERHFHPAKNFRPTKTTTGRSATINPNLKTHRFKRAKIYRPGDRGFRSSKKSVSPLAEARRFFDLPHQVIPCIQRKIRREVIMALHGGGASHAKKRRNANSLIGC